MAVWPAIACRTQTMKELALNDRPREKLLMHGPAALGDNELLAVVLGGGRRHSDALAVANELLARGGLHAIAIECG